jgi:hypothetical protein
VYVGYSNVGLFNPSPVWVVLSNDVHITQNEDEQMDPTAEWADQALAWLIDATLDGDVDLSLSFFQLKAPAQFLAIQFLRTSARSALRCSGVDENDFLAVAAGKFREWMVTEGVS